MSGKQEITVELDEEIALALQAHARRKELTESAFVEEVLREYLGFSIMERVWARSDLTEEEAMELAVSEQHALRAEQRARRV